ncbi:MAG: lysostaphin resistance A-like protein [Terriglobales bacterium]
MTSGPDGTAAPPASREPVWSGFEVGVVILFTVVAIVALTLIAWLGWAIAAQVLHLREPLTVELVALTLIGQTFGMLLGLLLARQWIQNVHRARFWQAIRWRQLQPETVLGVVVGGMVTIIGVQLLSRVLPMPQQVPMDRLFTRQTAWMLLIYGVAVAPFFEEFFFRGLIYPSLRAAFGEGMTPAELHEWRPLLRVLAGLGLVLVVWFAFRQAAMGTGPGWFALGLAAVALATVVVTPAAILRPAGALFNGLARWNQPELLAILLTGFLFGMLHAAQLGWAWAAVLILVLVGIILTWVRAATGSLMASWLFHCAYNGTLFAAQWYVTQGFRHFTPGIH